MGALHLTRVSGKQSLCRACSRTAKLLRLVQLFTIQERDYTHSLNGKKRTFGLKLVAWINGNMNVLGLVAEDKQIAEGSLNKK